jgi:hypothetical protein
MPAGLFAGQALLCWRKCAGRLQIQGFWGQPIGTPAGPLHHKEGPLGFGWPYVSSACLWMVVCRPGKRLDAPPEGRPICEQQSVQLLWQIAGSTACAAILRAAGCARLVRFTGCWGDPANGITARTQQYAKGCKACCVHSCRLSRPEGWQW